MRRERSSMNNRNSLDEFALQMQKIMKALHNHGRETLMELGFSFPQYYGLSLLGKGGEYEMSALKNDLAITGAFATAIADQLVEKGLAKRGRWATDRRVVNIVITDKGKKSLRLIRKKRNEFLSLFFNKIEGKDKKVIISALTRLSSAISELEQEK